VFSADRFGGAEVGVLEVVGVFEAVAEGSVDADVGEPDQGERGREWGVLPQAERDRDHGHRCGVGGHC
jgi:hypothetical protein